MNPRLFRVVAVGLLLALLIALGVWLYKLFSEPTEPTKKRAVQQIELLKPPPPPPPPKTPPPPPPPPQEQQKIDVPKPDAAPEQAAPAPPAGPTSSLPDNGTGGAFGLPPGDGSLRIGPVGGSGGGNRFAWYGALVKERITDAVLKDKKLREATDYQRVVNVWVDPSGLITRVELVGASPAPELDEALRLALRSLAPVREGAPGDMPQPIRLRISARS
ncbi:energy transducer TonB [Hydrogenophaga sp. ANAO-22]|jgi:protein TonB|uniref:energy transducer TonB family protein n=1 Tax=Hydrogenophaga sp. ANAO-22 TaxID=3166645 RepID=UPI0036D24C71